MNTAKNQKNQTNRRNKIMANLQNFTVYLKDGRDFQIKDVTFEIKESKLTFSNAYGMIAEYVYLPLNNVAAIIPEQNFDNKPYLTVYLKESDFKIVAERFKIFGDSELEFIWQDNRKIYSIYVDLSEVVAIVFSRF
ncbi:MAG: hypothetical protein LC778_01480 [Acidobacteria bacterium]|nr:hypothetical protein [Acidobacteriota bacterium]